MEKSMILRVGPAVMEIVIDEKIPKLYKIEEILRNFIVDEKPEAKLIIKFNPVIAHPDANKAHTEGFEMREGELFINSNFMCASFNVAKKEGLAYFFENSDLTSLMVLVYLRITFAILLLKHDCLLIHASGFANGGKGYIFVGSNGVGKSTIAMKAQNEGMQILGDDCMGIDTSKHILFSTPFKKKIDVLQSDFYSCAFVEKSNKFSRQIISERQAVYLLIKNNHIFTYLKKNTKPFIGEIIRLSAMAMKDTNSCILKLRLNDDIGVVL